MTLAEQINNFNRALEFDPVLTEGISVMNTFKDPVTFGFSKSFNDLYFSARIYEGGHQLQLL
jgi:hypothetical protein